MSNNRLELEGLEEFHRALRRLPENLANEAGDIVLAHAEEAKREVQSAYPEGPTGNLRARVGVERNKSKFGSSAILKARARHASIFEFGTRQRTTNAGANRGVMPKAQPSEAFIPKAIRARRRMTMALVILLERAGFQVNL